MSEKEVFSEVNRMIQEAIELTPEERQELIDYMREIAKPRIFNVFVLIMELVGFSVVMEQKKGDGIHE